jgi:hypothetical protein
VRDAAVDDDRPHRARDVLPLGIPAKDRIDRPVSRRELRQARGIGEANGRLRECLP